MIVAPSILSADFSCLGAQVHALDEAGADMIHIDVMDGNFVSDITVGPCVIGSIRSFTSKPFDVHLMINSAERHVDSFLSAGSDILTFHIESIRDLYKMSCIVRRSGKKIGVALNPGTSPMELEYVLDFVDTILVMTVYPGSSGQSFLENQIQKIVYIKKMVEFSKENITIGVDGGINPKTAALCVSAGADVLVAGSAIFSGELGDLQHSIESLKAVSV